MFESLVQKIASHPRYGPALAGAAARREPLALNYHSHGSPGDWCVSVCARQPKLLQLVGQEEPLAELAHIKGFGTSAEDCRRLCAAFGEALQAHYGLAAAPDILLDGRPLPVAPEA